MNQRRLETNIVLYDIDIKYLYTIGILPFDGRSKSWNAWKTRQLAKSAQLGWGEFSRVRLLSHLKLTLML